MLHSRDSTAQQGDFFVQRFPRPCCNPRTGHAAAGLERGAVRTSVLAFLFCCVGVAIAGNAGSGGSDPVAVAILVDAGRFATAEASIAHSLAQVGLTPTERLALEFERERMRRIHLDFTLDEAQVRARIREQIPDLRDDEFAAWDDAKLIEHRVIDGRKRYFNRAASNLYQLSPQALARRKPGARPLSVGPMEVPNAHQADVRAQALASGRSSTAPRRVRVTQSLTVEADAVPAGETLRAWIPYPRALPGQQEDIHLLGSVPSAAPGRLQIAPESTLQRTAYMQQPAIAGQPTKFSVSYELTIFGQYHAIDAQKVVPAPMTPETRAHLGERAPHIVFTDAMRQFSREVVGDETRPYHVAKKLYAAVDRIPWAGAREYSTISNISDHALHAGHADCGQQTLLLMTLLRLNGIPARWQSGMVYSDGDFDNLHDWGWMYLAPYGWVPMDVTTGRFSSGDPQLADFYFGGMDAYRIAFNDDYGQPFVPAKQHVRSETVDLQRGEVEWRGGNIYFDQWDYGFTATVLPTQPDNR